MARIVVIGTSRGGLNALSIVLSGLPRDFPLPVAVVQHRTRDADSSLSDLLQHQTPLPVIETDDKMSLEPGIIYLAPPDYHLLVDATQLSLSTEERVSFARPSIDVLFDSAATSFGSGVIAVILTGANEDGADGAAAVKRHGGRVVAQDPGEAESPTMPAAVVRRKLADAVLRLHEIAPYLVSVARI
jgi:two-component system chemotaxis response regulator CheB